MNLLILGGTQFIGRHLTEAALNAGHNVTLFNRNRRGAGLFSDVETLVGDRQGDVSALAGKTWDAVIDTSAYTPLAARRTAELLQNAVEHYTFVSSVSVYQDFSEAGMSEDAPVGTMTDEEVVEAETTAREPDTTGASYGELYGPLKARCEHIVEKTFPRRALIVRPGLVVGLYDYTDRFTYWVRRIGLTGKDQATEVLAPGTLEQQVQFIDARDLAAWMLDATVAGMTGAFHATGPDYALTFGDFLETTRHTLNPEAELVWVKDDFLVERGLEPGELMPWHPVGAMPGYENFFDIDISRAVANGLRFRPLRETIRDTFAWDQTRDSDEPLKVGLTTEREAALLDEWRSRSSV